MRYCRNCGSALNDEDDFCRKCGYKADPREKVSTPQKAAPSPDNSVTILSIVAFILTIIPIWPVGLILGITAKILDKSPRHHQSGLATAAIIISIVEFVLALAALIVLLWFLAQNHDFPPYFIDILFFWRRLFAQFIL